jgi:gamma-glutamylcysteine synthetase
MIINYIIKLWLGDMITKMYHKSIIEVFNGQYDNDVRGIAPKLFDMTDHFSFSFNTIIEKAKDDY